MTYYSQCCGEEMPDWPDRDICPYCKEHTGVEEEEDDEDIPLENDELDEHLNYYDNDKDFDIGGEG